MRDFSVVSESTQNIELLVSLAKNAFVLILIYIIYKILLNNRARCKNVISVRFFFIFTATVF